jgi:hypothetical protein
MKTAYELAMERLSKSAPAQKLTAKQKKQLAELDSKYAAKIAEREITLRDELSRAQAQGNFEEAAKAEQQLTAERQKIQAELEEKKEAIRQAGTA